ncbi:MAG TPA: cell division protein FtsZ [Desulfomonilia bacterium]|jgi:cell division protein FtsZ
MFVLEEVEQSGAKIKVIGVGGCGCNAVNNMIGSNIKGVDFLACNTDSQTLKKSLSANRVQIGSKLLKGMGAGGNPETGKSAAGESEEEIREALKGADMVFIATGLGGGTGTGASPIVARIAREMGALTVAVATKPFEFEGPRKMKLAIAGEKDLSENVDAIITIPNNRLLGLDAKGVPIMEAFKKSDEILTNAVKGISDLINTTGVVNVDFNDVKSVMCEKGKALMGIGSASGENRAAEAANMAISSPLLEDVDISGAKGILLNITGDPTVTIKEINEASKIIQAYAHEDANIIWGFVVNEDLADEFNLMVIATGYANKTAIRMKDEKEADNVRVLQARVVDYNTPTYIRNKEKKEKEVIKMGMVIDDTMVDMEAYNIPTFLRKKAD